MSSPLRSPVDVLVTIRFFDAEAAARLEARGYRVIRADIAYDELDTKITVGIERALETAHAWILGTPPVTRELLERFPRLKVIARRGVGYDSIDTAAVKSLGRLLTNTPGGGEPAVADHALAMMLAVGKRLGESHQRMQADDWRAIVGGELFGKTVGLVGFGRIGRMVAKRLKGFDARVLVFDPYLDHSSAEASGVTQCGLNELLAQSDFISLHAPLTPETDRLINTQTLALVKPGAILVNTSRGELVDETALLQALEAGRLGGAGLDVFAGEKDPGARGIAQKLLALPNVVGTPHTAASTRESLARANALAADCVAAALDGLEVPRHCIVSDGRVPQAA
ncbi:MAG: phosphoglycerate dehydrogenase [Acidovorax sp.]|uniref:phosphoglycerate dehydrogenase n=1 Tax=Acidovorax sp. TaxID=1872122 RepID=UPI002633A456|nr:phosphoglycerate dehydrogenase [Acidovorax sp.]MDH4462947.1 phosphoglycerate dehydrogenase [Acidovorax sp.]